MATPGYPSTRRYRTDGSRIKLHTAYYNNFWYDNYVNVHIINANMDVLPMINAYVANRLSICFAWYYTRGKLINTGRDTKTIFSCTPELDKTWGMLLFSKCLF